LRRRPHATDESGSFIVVADVMIAIWLITLGEAGQRCCSATDDAAGRALCL
jgi:hypothetical protein